MRWTGRLNGRVLETDGGGPWGSDRHDAGGSGGSTGGSGGCEGGGGLGPRNPWTEPPAPRKGVRGRPALSPAALDAMLRRGRQRFRGGLPEPRGRSFWLWGMLSLVALWLVTTSFHRIDPGERGVVTRLGRFEAVLGPGLQATLPAPFDQVVKLPVEQESRVAVGSPGGDTGALSLTGDGNLVDLAYEVRWKIRDPALYLFNGDPAESDGTIRLAAEAAMRAEVARMTLGDVIGSRSELLAERAAARAQALLDADRSGIDVLGITMERAALPAPLADLGRAQIAAEQHAHAELDDARNYALTRSTEATGEADAFNKAYAEYKLSPEVTRLRLYYDMMDDVLPKLDKTIVDAPGVTPTLPIVPQHRAAEGAQP